MTGAHPLATAKMSADQALDMLLPPERRNRNTLRAAMYYADAAHDRDPLAMVEKLEKLVANDPQRLVELVVGLAGLVDVDKTPSQLLAWMCPPTQQPKPRYGTEKCGTFQGHVAHFEAGEDPCRPCQAAFNRETVPTRQRKPAKCGEAGGWYRHQRHGTTVCEPCRTAIRAYWNKHYHEHYAPTTGKKRQPAECPSRGGYDRHIKAGEDACAGCISERRRYFRERARKQYDKIRKGGKTVLPCPTPAAKQRHRRGRQTCSICWPPGEVAAPAWYPTDVPLATNHGGETS